MVITGLAGVGAGILLFLVVLAATGPQSTRQAANAPFKVGSAKSLATAVARDGPLLFQDLLNRSRDIYVQHLGGQDWVAFEAHAPGAPRRCVLQWRPGSRDFLDPCDAGGRTYPGDGTGLTAYPARIDSKGVLTIQLGQPFTASTTSAPPTTSTTAVPPTPVPTSVP
ncbi:MAG: hypothetical protein LC733_12740 [Actinobacteria bacterium]|nr:hypothetical protein [Actinomycetota bacterium]